MKHKKHHRKFHKHKLLLDENMPPRLKFRRLNGMFDIKHIRDDLHKEGSADTTVYKEAVKRKRLVVTFNGDDFKLFAAQSKHAGVIEISTNLSDEQIDKKLTAFLVKSSAAALNRKFNTLTGETEV